MANLIPYGKGESSIVKPKTNISKALVKISKVKSDGGKIVQNWDWPIFVTYNGSNGGRKPLFRGNAQLAV
jgi:hypothetical protein